MNQVPGLISAFSSNGRVCADAGLNLLLNLLKQRLEVIEVLALLAIGDFLGGALVGAGADMAKLGDVGCACRALQFGKQFVLVHRLRRRGGSSRPLRPASP